MAEINQPQKFSHLQAISSLDGRFRGRVENYSQYFSEFAIIKSRVQVEIEYLIALLQTLNQPLSQEDQTKLRNIYQNFGLSQAEEIWQIDERINHDVKAVELFLGTELVKLKLDQQVNFLHFGLTSADIDSTALAINLKNFIQDQYLKQLLNLITKLNQMAKDQADLVMPARTHGQIAVPTTAGKELANFSARLSGQLEILKKLEVGAKFSGAVGNHNALVAAYPEKNWLDFSNQFLASLGLKNYTLTTQVEPYEDKIELFQTLKRINSIIIGLDMDLWRYLAIGYLTLNDDQAHVGSSTMPQKINPIGFEMSESYLNLANGIFGVLEAKLPINRWQRDLTDKYLLRELGQAMVMSILACESTSQALENLSFNSSVIADDLSQHWEVIAEGVQTILRTTNYPDPYEAVKNLTRGKVVTQSDYEKFIASLDVPETIKLKLTKLSPQTYTGLAQQLTQTLV